MIRTASPAGISATICTRRSTATTIDHERPIADTGADVWWNFVPACEDCNRWEKGRTARRWVVSRSRSPVSAC
ncbi:HNH endonuclease signature motif containing protein [Streptomyces violaceus]|uniref:HNH endonuclease signature motif containing protein n=1 Tax=Streptomyces violaceus TaxID=1936 RepID=UPI00399D68BB